MVADRFHPRLCNIRNKTRLRVFCPMPNISPVERGKRLRKLEILLYQGKSTNKIAEALGVRRETVWRYLKGRQVEVESSKPEQRSLLRQELINRCLKRMSIVESTIAEETDPRVILQGQDVLTRIERRLSSIIGADEPIRHQVLMAHYHQNRPNGTTAQPVNGAGGVHISFEGFEGGDPDFEPAHNTAKPIAVDAQSANDTQV
jgi:hypothetical protein